MMRYGSVCSGIEAATAAWHGLGWTASFYSEIDKFPRAVLQHHYPNVPLHGDFTTIGEKEYDPIDLLVGGTPCQSFSIAGLRKGMDDARGNLALGYLALASRLRPRWVVWENVPGVLSSNGGRDFGSFLGGLVECGYGFAYRVLDAQYFGLAQRRKRVFVVGYLGDWRRAASVLFEPESLRGDSAPRREIEPRTAESVGGGPPGNGEIGLTTARADSTRGGQRHDPTQETFIAHSLMAQAQASHQADSETYVTHTLRGSGFDASEDGSGRGTPLVPVAYSIMPQNSGKDYKARQVDVAQPVMAGGPVGGNQGGDVVVQAAPSASVVAFNHQSGGDFRPQFSNDLANGLQRSQGQAVAFTQNQDGHVLTGDIAAAIGCNQNATGRNTAKVQQAMAVRRLTPRECERLQGFPDDYTLIPYRGKPAADGPRYKALGNSMAVPVMKWIGQRIQMVDDILLEKSA